MSSEEILQGLTAASARLDQARHHVAAAAEAAAEAQTLVSAALRGSSAGPLVAMIGSVREGSAKVAGEIPAVKSRLEETIQRVRALGN